MVFILYGIFNKKMGWGGGGAYSYFTQLENMNNKICLRRKYELSTHTYLN